MIRYVHGSEDSLDVDVFYVFDKMPSFKECQEFCSNKEENRNIIVVNNGIVVDCFKGTSDEINNGLLDTYSLHQQKHEIVVTKRLERDLLIKTIRVMRCLLSHCSRTQYRDEVKRALKSSSWKERIEVLKSIDFSSIEDYGKSGSKEDVYKVFAFQLGQIFGLGKEEEYYTKSSIGIAFPELKSYLYREKNTDPALLCKNIKAFIKVVSLYEVNEKDGIVFFKDFNKSFDLRAEKYI